MKRRRAAKLYHPATEIQMRVEIRPGPASLAQKTAWHRFWQKVIAEVKGDDGRPKSLADLLELMFEVVVGFEPATT